MTAPRPMEESYDRDVDLKMWRRLFRYALHYRRDMTLLAISGVFTAGANVEQQVAVLRHDVGHTVDQLGSAQHRGRVLVAVVAERMRHAARVLPLLLENRVERRVLGRAEVPMR